MSDNDNASNRDATSAQAPLIVSGLAAAGSIRPPQPERPDLMASEHIVSTPGVLLNMLPAGTLLSDI